MGTLKNPEPQNKSLRLRLDQKERWLKVCGYITPETFRTFSIFQSPHMQFDRSLLQAITRFPPIENYFVNDNTKHD